MIKYVQLNEAGTQVVSVFGGPQDPAVYPNQAEVEDDDPLYLAYILSITPVQPDLASLARDQRDSLLTLAAIRIAPLQDAVDIDEATTAEVALLKKWKKYRVDLSRIDLQPGFPMAIDWPVAPA